MNFFFNSFHFLLVLNYYYVGSKEFLDFTFQAMALGHSGLLITWELTESSSRKLYEASCDPYRFKFNACIAGTNTTINTNESINYSGNTATSCEGQYKIHSLNESTYYEVRIQQAGSSSFVDIKVPLKTYFVKGKTNVKTNSMPAKPHFEYLPPGTPSNNYLIWGKIRWYPCGKERNCHDKEPGTHFGVHIKFRMKHTRQDYDDNLPIAKPDFNYQLSKYDKDDVWCELLFQWLPCSQSFDCKNTKPGSDYVYKIEPDPLGDYYKEYGSYYGWFERNVEYDVTLTSSVGNNFSEPVTKKFKNCSIY